MSHMLMYGAGIVLFVITSIKRYGAYNLNVLCIFIYAVWLCFSENGNWSSNWLSWHSVNCFDHLHDFINNACSEMYMKHSISVDLGSWHMSVAVKDKLPQTVDMTAQPPLALSIQQEVQLRFLGPSDVAEVKKLCREWFPIEWVNRL